MTADGPLSTTHLPRPDPTRGVFETLLVVDGRPIELDAHLDRLARSVRELFGPPTMARVVGPARVLVEARARELAPAADAASPALARLRLTLAPDAQGRLDLSAVTAEVDPAAVFPPAGHGPAIAPVTVAGGLGAHKWADRRLLDQASAALDGALPLIVDADGSVLETERANVFLVEGDVLATPPADGRILPGIARARVIEIADELGIELHERRLALDDFGGADAIFLTGSVRGVEPVVAIDGAPCPGDDATTARVADALRARWLGVLD